METKYNEMHDKMFGDTLQTASPADLTLMLYEGCIKFLNQAIVAMEKKDYMRSNQVILRVEDILREFQMTLDFQYALSQELYDLYDYMHGRLVEGNMTQNVEIIEEVLGMFREFRDTWKEAMKLAKDEAKMEAKAKK